MTNLFLFVDLCDATMISAISLTTVDMNDGGASNMKGFTERVEADVTPKDWLDKKDVLTAKHMSTRY